MTVKFKANSDSWLTQSYHPLDIEKSVRNFWENNGIAKKIELAKLKSNKGVLGYVEGPPTLNGYPHVGHVWGRVMKDLHYRWKTMQGYYIPFWAGWDCQGLPVELEVERQLGVNNKKDLLERVGEEKFIAECKKTIVKYYNAWHNADYKVGVFINADQAYWTYSDEYIEREWKYLKSAWDQGLLDEGYYVVAYCPHCQTSLSNAEVGMGYEQVDDPSLHFKFRVARSAREYFLVWTTMPFTLVTDLLLAVHPKAEYARVKVKDETWIMAKERIIPTMKELEVQHYEVVGVVMGEELKGVKYEYPFLDIIPKQQELDHHPPVHRIVCENFVDVTTATGVVHLAPGNGEEDFQVARKHNIPVFAPFDDEANFTNDAGRFAGLFARAADEVVVEELKKRDLLVSIKRTDHEYPTCWRSHHKLVWIARREYYLWTDRINDKIMEAAKAVEYFFKPPRNRFLAFLGEKKPWCFSRERVWGTPLPVWRCDQCGEKILISSKNKLFEKAAESPKGHFELHKPWVDRVVLLCETCGGKMHREPFVLDTWHNSGAAPYARFTDEEFERYVPVDFLVEAIDQTRGWANTLLLEHVILSKKAESPYKAFLFYGHTLDEKGRKMSKSMGNFIDANEILDKHSADVFRFYVLRKCSPIESMNFDAKELGKRPFQVLSTFYHLFRFFMQNAEYDGFDPQKHTLEWTIKKKILALPDQWLLSKLQNIVRNVTDRFNSCEFNVALQELEKFVVDLLSHQYVPMVRHELWSDDQETRDRRLAIYTTLWQTLSTLNLIFNPVTPFICELMYQRVNRTLVESAPESINFEKWPVPNEKMMNPKLESSFDLLLKYVSLTYSARQKAKLKRRWPLKKAVLAVSEDVRQTLKKLEGLFLELSNVKTVDYVETLQEMKPEKLKKGTVASENEMQAWIDTYRDERLVGEGLMRDLARRIQTLRKELGFTPTEILEVVQLKQLNPESMSLLSPHVEMMADLVRTKQIEFHERSDNSKVKWHEFKLDNQTISIAIPRNPRK